MLFLLFLYSESISWIGTDDGQLSRNCIDETGLPRSIGERWEQGACVNCTCEEINGVGSLSCHATMCKSCERPAPLVPGECCPHCLERGNDTESITTGITTSTSSTNTYNLPIGSCDSLEDCEPPCHLGAVDDLDSCPTCECPNDVEVKAITLINRLVHIFKINHVCQARLQ